MARILIADDDANFRSVLGSVLENAGHEPGFAADGEQAVDVYNRGAFDLAIIDLVLPAKNGVQVIREILKLDPAAKLIAISGKEPAQLELAAEAGALRTLAKPFATEELIEAVAALLRRSTGWQGVVE